ncbi:PSP1 domain-containing protein [Thermoanaerobacterium thermosaccharolyticum]|uniref:PSP1 domain-containing protein n=1 Tax=Thermoanaerobacterium thermosaccharolyticum TaxID=1517 RepID=UPI001786C4FB|nr:stage 0 sporulation family protein [Thermoanaerobacterium thermosaccharolyticum]MBE0067527.1 stage 0 sporulation family protein [Thermoanaerobacterium thermosaccharolyticum]MBE0227059.1 stage 0 sporulation family protein [Thermoanaerobacterium thermosaccharolyticum]
MYTVVGIRFKKAGKIYYFDPGDLPVNVGDNVIVETARGIEFGEVVVGKREVDDNEIIAPLKMVLRIATDEDLEHYKENKDCEAEAFGVCMDMIKEHNLDMKLIDVEYTFDNNKIIFYFTADGRIDFRDLVKDLAAVFKTRIELRQIGVRDESKIVGGLGPCGRPLCCVTFLGDFEPVSIKMAKDQNLSLNPTKISGLCGRLMCCLKYEQDTYEEVRSELPSVGSLIKVDDKEMRITEVDVVRKKLKVKMKNAEGIEITKEYDPEDVTVIEDNKDNKKDEISEIYNEILGDDFIG